MFFSCFEWSSFYCSLKSLNLRKNCLTDKGVSRFCAPFKLFRRGPEHLTVLDVSGITLYCKSVICYNTHVRPCFKIFVSHLKIHNQSQALFDACLQVLESFFNFYWNNMLCLSAIILTRVLSVYVVAWTKFLGKGWGCCRPLRKIFFLNIFHSLHSQNAFV